MHVVDMFMRGKVLGESVRREGSHRSVMPGQRERDRRHTIYPIAVAKYFGTHFFQGQVKLGISIRYFRVTRFKKT